MGDEANDKKIETETIPLTKRTLHWKAFFFGVVVVLLIEVFAVNIVNSTNSSTASTLTPSKIPPTPTKPPAIPANWSTYTDPINNFSLRYPADKFTLDAKPGFSLGTLHIQIISNKSKDVHFGNEILPNELGNLRTAILQGSQFSSLQPGMKDSFKTMRLGSNNFVRVYPISAEGCFCDQIEYITQVKDAFVVISMALGSQIPPAPGATITRAPTQISKISGSDYKKRILTDKEQLIIDQFGDIEKILASFKSSQNIDK